MHPPGRRSSPAGAAFVLIGGVIFVASLLGFVHAWFFRWGQPAGASGSAVVAIAVDVLLFTAFAMHHSAFARLGVRDWVRAHVAAAYERTTYVWISSVLFFAVYAAWQPVPGVAWQTSGVVAGALYALEALGMGIAVRAAARLDVLDLAGVRQGFGLVSPRPATIVADGLYGFVRHPIYFGWLLIVWCPPVMTGTRLVFAAISTAYLVVAVPLEERALRITFGPTYAAYARHVRWRMLPGVY